jgi:hypothetical protein
LADRVTTVAPRAIDPEFKGQGIGLTHHGRESRADMIAAFRKYHENQMRKAQYALALTDDELIVTTYRGVWAQNNIQEVTE